MRTVRKRMYIIDPRYRNQRSYRFVARRFEGFTRVNEEGHSRANIVAHGYASTPQKAKLRARKRVHRRPRREVKSAIDMADKRRYHEYLDQSPMFRPPTRAEMAMVRSLLACEHEWRETHPRAYSAAETCNKCGRKRGTKPGRPDPLRYYF